jgi:hypothetical protein
MFAVALGERKAIVVLGKATEIAKFKEATRTVLGRDKKIADLTSDDVGRIVMELQRK